MVGKSPAPRRSPEAAPPAAAARLLVWPSSSLNNRGSVPLLILSPYFPSFFILARTIWAVLAIVLDYIFIVKLLAPVDGYYKLDVYLYYANCLLLPLAAAALRRNFAV